MPWIKRGLVFRTEGKLSWAADSALTPTPILINEEVIRVYAGFRDNEGVSRIGFVDVDPSNPARVLRVAERPVLDIGLPGTFDDNGVILGDVVRCGEELRMFYVGFQIVQKVKFLAFTGLAISTDGGESFQRYSSAPILDRSDKERSFRAIHSVQYNSGKWMAWAGVGSDWETIAGKVYPRYNIRYYESSDGITFPEEGNVVIDVRGDEYRIGRPRVYMRNNSYVMYYTRGMTDMNYVAGYAESYDGIRWERHDDKLGIDKSPSGWDSEMLCYPSLIAFEGREYMFYNGNAYGRDGFGYAERVDTRSYDSYV